MNSSATSYRPGQLDQASKSTNGIRNLHRDEECPICHHKGGWCSRFTDTGNVICKRVESPIPCRNDGGWIHIINTGPYPRPRARSATIKPVTYDSPLGIHNKHQQHLRNMTPELLQLASKDLGLSASSLTRLGLGCVYEIKMFPYGAWTWPMWGPAGQLIGVKYRCILTGDKITGSGDHNGLFIPDDLHIDGNRLMICEGLTDTAAALDMGFNAVGRDGCTGCRRHVLDLIRTRKPSDVVIMADNDKAGQDGARKLANSLVCLGQWVRVIAPPPGIKDLRKWYTTGASRSDVLQIIDQTEPVMVKVI